MVHPPISGFCVEPNVAIDLQTGSEPKGDSRNPIPYAEGSSPEVEVGVLHITGDDYLYQ